MVIALDRTGTPERFSELLAATTAWPEVKAILILAGADNDFTPAQVDAALCACPKPLFGGIVPELLFEYERLPRGTLLLGLQHDAQVLALPGLSLQTLATLNERLEKPFSPSLDSAQIAFLFVDCLSQNIGALTTAVFSNLGFEIHYLGGGCGAVDLQPRPCIFTRDGLVADTAVLAVSSTPSGVGMAHGWVPLGNTLKVTEAQGNAVISLDWRPAFTVYRELAERYFGDALPADQLFSHARRYRFGITRLDAEVLVREPLGSDGQRLFFAGEVPEGAFLRILDGDPAQLAAAAVQAREQAQAAYQGAADHVLTLLVDCTARALLLGENGFANELAAVHDGTPLVGFLSLGEIGKSGYSYLEFCNETVVIGRLEHDHARSPAA